MLPKLIFQHFNFLLEKKEKLILVTGFVAMNEDKAKQADILITEEESLLQTL